MNTNSVGRVRQNLRPHLPKSSSQDGKTCSDLQSACDDFVSRSRSGQEPQLDPYSSNLSKREKIRTSEELSQFAGGVESDFQALTESTSPLRLHQVNESLNRMGNAAQDKLEAASTERSSLRKSYAVQVAKTVGWMAATGASLMVGLVAAPISVPLVAVTATMAVRSIAKARAANKKLAAEQPALDKEIKAQNQIVADAQNYGSHVESWNEALNSGPTRRLEAKPQFAFA